LDTSTVHRRELGVAKEEMKDPYSVLDNAEEEHHADRIAYTHETIPVAAFFLVLERVQEVHDACLFDYPHGEIPMNSESQYKLWPVFHSWNLYHADIRPARDDGKSLLMCLEWRSRKRKKYKKKLKQQHLPDDLYHHWIQTEVQDVHL
jgi:hypothetical protein